MKEYYVYEWIRLDTNEPFYVGKGKGDRCFNLRKRNKYFNDILKYCDNKSIEVAIHILDSNLTNNEALLTECWYIDFYIFKYGYNITNQTWGGDGGDVVSMMTSEEKVIYSLKMSKSCQGKNKGHFHSEEVKEKISKAKKGKYSGENNPMYGKNIKDYMSEEKYIQWKEKIRITMLGKVHTDKSKEKMRQSALGRKVSEATKEKLRNANVGDNNPMYGKKHSEKTRKLIAKGNEKSLVVEFKDGKKMFFESRNKCANYFDEKYNISIFTIKQLLRTGDVLNSRYSKFKEVNGMRIYYIK